MAIKDDQLLSRDDFRESVFARDNHKCVFCDSPAVDAHHIIERRLWDNGGYLLGNGISVCEVHHLECEMTKISVEDARIAAEITKPVIPEWMYFDQVYDKWGNPILDNGQRLRGELFYDESVQKILKQGGVLDLFTNRVKYPRTYHVFWSEGMHDDDRMLKSMDNFVGKRVIVSTKMDGENANLYSDGIHARSIDGRHHYSRDWVKNFWGSISGDIPENWRICGENLFAKHSIGYDNLDTYFYGFSIWNERNICLSWDETLEWFSLIGITPVPVLYDGLYDEKAIRALYDPKVHYNTREGYVVRLADSFSYGQFRNSVGKFVRKNHVATSAHWMHGRQIEQNGLKNE